MNEFRTNINGYWTITHGLRTGVYGFRAQKLPKTAHHYPDCP